MRMKLHQEPPAALRGVSRLDFQKALNRAAYGHPDNVINGRDANIIMAYASALNAVLVQGLDLFFSTGGNIGTPAQARFALALYGADPGQFRFDGCTCGPDADCPHRRDWLDWCRQKAREAST